MRIIPAIDIIEGKCVRLTKGAFNTVKVYHDDPVGLAQQLEDHGIEYLHLVDLEGAKSKHIVNYKTLESIAKRTQLKIDFGGGLKSDEDVKIAFECGADQITGGSIAANDPKLFLRWLIQYGSEKIILGADCKNRKIYTNGWLKSSSIEVLDFIQEYAAQSVQQVICTDIDKDGQLEGPSYDLYQEIIDKCPVQLIASGGITSVNDLLRLRDLGCEGAIVGKAIYEGKISLKEIQNLC